MKAIVQQHYGDTDQLALRDVPRPEPGPGEVLVAVEAAGVDRGVWHLMAGRPLLVRLGFGLRAPRTRTPGFDLAGIVAAVGPDVTAFAPGDAVFGIGKGTYAEHAIAPVSKLAHRPDVLPPVEAAALAISGLTGLQAVRDQAQVQPGQTVLVMGASGGVGSYAVQVAKAHGAEVTGVASTTKLDLVRGLGADHVVDHTREDPLDGARTWDVIIDTGGNRRLRDLRRALAPDGTLVIVGGEQGGGPLLGGFDRQLRAQLLSPFVGQRLRTFLSSEDGGDIATLAAMVEAGQLRPAVERTFPLHEAPKAIDHLVAGHARGKVVVTVGT